MGVASVPQILYTAFMKRISRLLRDADRRRWVMGIGLLVLFAAIKPAVGQDGAWEELPSLPITIANNAVTSVDQGNGQTTIYSFMGIEEPRNAGTITPASFRLNVPGSQWQPIADAPLLNGRAKIGASAVTVKGMVYLIGGYTVDRRSETTEHRLFRYDPDIDDYVQLADVPVEVDDTVAAVYQDRYIYLISGWHGPVNNNVLNVQVYDPKSDTWAQATPIPGPSRGLFGHAGTIIENRIIYGDGVRTGGGFHINDRVFVGTIDPAGEGDVTSIDWIEVAAHSGSPTYRAAASQGPANRCWMLLIGGTDNPYNFNGTGYNGEPSEPLDQILAYKPATDQWCTLAAIGDHQPTMDHRGLVRAGSTWVTVGGMVAPGQATDKVYRLKLKRKPRCNRIRAIKAQPLP